LLRLRLTLSGKIKVFLVFPIIARLTEQFKPPGIPFLLRGGSDRRPEYRGLFGKVEKTQLFNRTATALRNNRSPLKIDFFTTVASYKLSWFCHSRFPRAWIVIRWHASRHYAPESSAVAGLTTNLAWSLAITSSELDWIKLRPTSLRGVPKQVSGRRRKRIPLARLCDYGPLGMGWRLRKISNYPCRPEIEHRGIGYVEK
jgi:hypothetical protein